MKNGHLQPAEVTALDKRHYAVNDLFPETLPPVIPALWPVAGTRPAEALEVLLTGPTNQADYPRLGWRLAAYVKELEYDGWSFLKRDIERNGCRRPITEYRLNYSDPATKAALSARGLA